MSLGSELRPFKVNLGQVNQHGMLDQLRRSARLELSPSVIGGSSVPDVHLWMLEKIEPGLYSAADVGCANRRYVQLRRVFAFHRGVALVPYSANRGVDEEGNRIVIDSHVTGMVDEYMGRLNIASRIAGRPIEHFFPNGIPFKENPIDFLRNSVRVRIRLPDGQTRDLAKHLCLDVVTAVVADYSSHKIFVAGIDIERRPYLNIIDARSGDQEVAEGVRECGIPHPIISMAIERRRQMLIAVSLDEREKETSVFTSSIRHRDGIGSVLNPVEVKGMGKSIRRVEVNRGNIFLSTALGQLLLLNHGNWRFRPVVMGVPELTGAVLAGITRKRLPVYVRESEREFLIGTSLLVDE